MHISLANLVLEVLPHSTVTAVNIAYDPEILNVQGHFILIMVMSQKDRLPVFVC